MKTLFYVLLALWLGGGLLFGLVGDRSTQAFFVNIFGIPAIIVGIILLVRRYLMKGNDETPTTKP